MPNTLRFSTTVEKRGKSKNHSSQQHFNQPCIDRLELGNRKWVFAPADLNRKARAVKCFDKPVFQPAVAGRSSGLGQSISAGGGQYLGDQGRPGRRIFAVLVVNLFSLGMKGVQLAHRLGTDKPADGPRFRFAFRSLSAIFARTGTQDACCLFRLFAKMKARSKVMIKVNPPGICLPVGKIPAAQI